MNWNELNGQKLLDIRNKLFSRTAANNDCIDWNGSKDGYGYGNIWVNGSCQKTHRVSFALANGFMPGKLVCHKCDRPACVNPDHLFEGSYKDNVQDCIKKQRRNSCKGSNFPRSTLSESSVAEIRREYSQGARQKYLASKYSVNLSAIKHAINSRSWKHVEEEAALRKPGSGTKNPSAILTEEDVRNIRLKYHGGLSQKHLALLFGVSRSTIGAITTRKTWTHI